MDDFLKHYFSSNYQDNYQIDKNRNLEIINSSVGWILQNQQIRFEIYKIFLLEPI